jgi:hypothetical protein
MRSGRRKSKFGPALIMCKISLANRFAARILILLFPSYRKHALELPQAAKQPWPSSHSLSEAQFSSPTRVLIAASSLSVFSFGTVGRCSTLYSLVANTTIGNVARPLAGVGSCLRAIVLVSRHCIAIGVIATAVIRTLAQVHGRLIVIRVGNLG